MLSQRPRYVHSVARVKRVVSASEKAVILDSTRGIGPYSGQTQVPTRQRTIKDKRMKRVQEPSRDETRRDVCCLSGNRLRRTLSHLTPNQPTDAIIIGRPRAFKAAAAADSIAAKPIKRSAKSVKSIVGSIRQAFRIVADGQRKVGLAA